MPRSHNIDEDHSRLHRGHHSSDGKRDESYRRINWNSRSRSQSPREDDRRQRQKREEEPAAEYESRSRRYHRDSRHDNYQEQDAPERRERDHQPSHRRHRYEEEVMNGGHRKGAVAEKSFTMWRYPGEGVTPLSKRPEFTIYEEDRGHRDEGPRRRRGESPDERRYGRRREDDRARERQSPGLEHRRRPSRNETLTVDSGKFDYSNESSQLLSERWRGGEADDRRAGTDGRERRRHHPGGEEGEVRGGFAPAERRPRDDFSRYGTQGFRSGFSGREPIVNAGRFDLTRRNDFGFQRRDNWRGRGRGVFRGRGTIVYRPGDADAESKPVMNLFDPQKIPKGRGYFEHDERSSSFDRRGGRGFRRGWDRAPVTYPLRRPDAGESSSSRTSEFGRWQHDMYQQEDSAAQQTKMASDE